MELKFDKDGLVPIIIQDANSGLVLSLFYANETAIGKMKKTGFVWRFSRSQGKLMLKGDSSGNYQRIVSMSADCDGDALLVQVIPEGPACHTGKASCFGDGSELPILSELVEVIRQRKERPTEKSYTAKVVSDRKYAEEKLREECQELIEAEKPADLVWEAADLLFFTLVYLENRNIKWEDVLKELKRRRTSPKTK